MFQNTKTYSHPKMFSRRLPSPDCYHFQTVSYHGRGLRILRMPGRTQHFGHGPEMCGKVVGYQDMLRKGLGLSNYIFQTFPSTDLKPIHSCLII